jgi:hypothetical protein
MSTEFLSPNWRMPRNANQSKSNNYSLDFTFADASYIDFGNNIPTLGYVNSTDTFSISTWVNTAWGSQYVFGNRDSTSGFSFTTYPLASSPEYNGLLLRVGSTDIVATLDRNDLIYNSWVHFVWVYDGSGTNNSDKIKAYQNGIPLSLTFPFGNFPSTISSNLNFYAGAYTWTGTLVGQYEGGLNELSIFDYALSQSQVTTLYGDSTNGQGNPMALPSTPIAYYPLGTSAWNGQYLAENNAIEDYVFDFPATDAVQSNFTLFNGASEACISAWFKTDVQQSGKCLFSTPFSSGSNKFDLYFQSAGFSSYLKTVTNISNIASSTINYYDNKWHNVIVTYDGVNHKIYYDGNEVATAARSGVLADSTYNKLEIGRFGTSYSNNVNAKISNVLAWTKGLSSSEATTLYNYGSPIQTLANIPQSSNLKAWYKLDASDIYDSSTTKWNNIEAKANNKGSMLCGYNAWSGQALVQSYNSPVERSISIWVRRTASMGYHGVCTQPGVGGAQAYSQFFVWSNRGYTMSFFVPSPNKWVDFGYMAPDTWYHAVLTDTGVTAAGRFKTYWNGEFANSSTDLTYDLGTFTNGFKWAGGGGLGLWSGGNIADGRLFDTVLSASEVETLYNNGAPSTLNNVKPNNLKQWLTFENIDTSVGGGLYDKSGNNNQLTTPLYPWVAARAAGNLNVPISALNGLSSGMSQSNLVQSDLQTVAPYSKYAINFNSANSDYIDCENNSIFDITSALTLSAWVKLSSATSNQFYISKRGSSDAYQISSFSNKAVGMSIWIGGSRKDLIGTTNHVQDVWYHVVGTYDGSYMRVYVNGTEENSVAQTGAIGTTTAKLILGAYDGVGWSLDGNLSNCSIWNTALTPSQVREIYNEGLPSNLHNFSGAAPVAWWKLGEGVSYDSTNLHVRDYIGSNHGVSSSSMDQSDIVNGVGTSNNGTGNGFSAPSSTITNIFSGPYSDKNAVSVNMQSAKTNSGIDTSTPQAT